MTSNRAAVEPGEGGIGGPNHANGSTSTEPGCVLTILQENNALSLASEEKKRGSGERTFAASTIAFPFPSIYTKPFQ